MKCDICTKKIVDIDFKSDDAGEYHWSCWENFCKKEALLAGIPQSVIDGKTKLSDHFFKSYINFKCNKN